MTPPPFGATGRLPGRSIAGPCVLTRGPGTGPFLTANWCRGGLGTWAVGRTPRIPVVIRPNYLAVRTRIDQHRRLRALCLGPTSLDPPRRFSTRYRSERLGVLCPLRVIAAWPRRFPSSPISRHGHGLQSPADPQTDLQPLFCTGLGRFSRDALRSVSPKRSVNSATSPIAKPGRPRDPVRRPPTLRQNDPRRHVPRFGTPGPDHAVGS